jgi:hypothetical protein
LEGLLNEASKIRPILFIFSALFLWISQFACIEEITPPEELQHAFPLYLGFPIAYAELDTPRIDPSFPYSYD